MSTPHINAKDNDFANVVLMPGDPNRARWMAETFLHDYKLVSDVRANVAYTGYTKNNKKISIMASGMGQPAIGIYSYELFNNFGVDTIIRVGTCGSYQEKIDLFDILLVSTASTDSNWCGQYKLNGHFSAGADFELLNTAYREVKKAGHKYHVGNILSADVFYDVDPNMWKEWAKLGVMGVEMESYSLYCNAARLGKRALCMLTVTDHFTKQGKATPEERSYGLTKMIEVAITTAEKYAKE